MFDAELLRVKFESALPYDEYVATGKPDQQEAWEKIHASATLTETQRTLVRGFTREMRVLVSSGVWCGDCSQQCPLIARIAEANPEKVQLRFIDRDEHPELRDALQINQGARVPTALFLAEDDEFAAMFGDRTLSRYRALAERQLGASCPLPGAPVPADEVKATLQDWLNEIERVQLLLRLSPRLRQRHGD